MEKSYESPDDLKLNKHQPVNFKYVLLITCITALGGFLFGYDNGSISGTIGFLQTHFNLSPASVGWVTSSIIVGCLLGVIFAGKLSDLFGRKKVLIVCAFLFAINSFGAAFAPSVNWLVFWRIIGGIGIGMEITIAPLYIAEISPARLRGRLVSFNQLLNTVGNLMIFTVSAIIASLHTELWNIEYGWRWIFGTGALPAILFLILLFFVPESPRWLVKKNKSEEALTILEKINGSKQAKTILQDISQSVHQKKGSLLDFMKTGTKVALIVGVAIAFFQQITGINAVIYYAPEIFKMTGSGHNAAMISTIMIGVVLVVFTLLSIWIIDKVGRRLLLLAGSSVMSLCLIGTGFAFGMENINGTLILVFLLTYIAAFAVSFGTVAYVIISEFFPTQIRGLAASIATLFLYMGQFLVSQFFPVFVDSIGPSITFYIFAILSIIALLFTVKFVPETKGKSLEEIEKSFMSN